MIKIRLMGTEKELYDFKEYLAKYLNVYRVKNVSDMYRNKGSSKHLRMYMEIEKNSEKKEQHK